MYHHKYGDLKQYKFFHLKLCRSEVRDGLTGIFA